LDVEGVGAGDGVELPVAEALGDGAGVAEHAARTADAATSVRARAIHSLLSLLPLRNVPHREGHDCDSRFHDSSVNVCSK
jgi:hypothetical protein